MSHSCALSPVTNIYVASLATAKLLLEELASTSLVVKKLKPMILKRLCATCKQQCGKAPS
jgi:hypothetical protein